MSYIFSLFLILSFSLEAKSLLYELHSKNSRVYILGSIHLAKAELYPLKPEITEAYKNSDILAVELDPSSQESVLKMQEMIANSGAYPSGKSLKTELSSQTYRALQDYINKTGISFSSIEGTKPWVLMMQLSVTEMMRLGYSPELGIDKYFLDKAKIQRKPVVSLETAEEQIALLSRDDRVFQDRLLLYTLESMNELEPMLNEMFIQWHKGNTKAFEEILFKPLQKDTSLKEVYTDLIIKRNYKMAQKIEEFLRTGRDYFVVVGSGHVVGDEGIVALLKRRGYKLTQR